jgi:uncharacterized protein YjbI with pentapeptide repeats
MFFECKMKQTNFTRALASGGVFEDCEMEGAIFNDANLTGRIFIRCSFDDETKFNGAIVNGTRFLNCTVNEEPMTSEWLLKQNVVEFSSAKIDTNEASAQLSFRGR